MKGHIQKGSQLVAPEGFGELQQGVTYYFLSSRDAVVTLIEFVVRPGKKRKKKFTVRGKPIVREVIETPTPLVQRHFLQQEAFEGAVDLVLITLAEEQYPLPPWLDGLAELNLIRLDSLRKDRVMSHVRVIERRVEAIWPLVRLGDELLSSEDCDERINQYARHCSPRQNEARTRLNFFVYVLFNGNPFALHYPINRIGRWSRDVVRPLKRGRPSRKGKHHGFNVTPAMAGEMVEDYLSFSKVGRTLSEIYRKHLARRGCLERANSKGLLEFYHPKGEPFASFDQFVYHVQKAMGKRRVYRMLRGRAKTRSNGAHRGQYSERLSNVFEKIERDGYFVEDLPRGPVDGSTLPPLCVVHGRDTASGIEAGIGFSLGAESSSAYRMERFCEAVPKPYFGRLIGLEISEADWPCVGVPSYETHDRGSGSVAMALGVATEARPAVREITPSYSGQSKATVESSNPKTPKIEGAPSHFKSDKTVIELVRREVQRVIMRNRTMDVSDRIPPDLLNVVPNATPNALYQAMAERGRSCAGLMSIDDAVRTFLTVVPAKLTAQGVVMDGHLFRSDELINSDELNKVHGMNTLDTEVRVMDFCVRYVWYEMEGKLLELELTFATRVDSEEKFLSLNELRERASFMRERDAGMDENRKAVQNQVERNYKAETGKSWGSGSRVPGRPKRGGIVAKREAAETKKTVMPRAPKR